MPTSTFDYTGGWQRFAVPDDVRTLDVTIKGASSGTRQGALVTGKISVRDKDVIHIFVGQRGRAHSGRNGGDVADGGGGAGGDGATGRTGGDGGGGGSWLRLNARDGRIIAVAGGAGGTSGDGGLGGRGGPATGEHGSPASVSAQVGNATGGTGAQPGRGGTSASGTAFYGKDGHAGKLARAGKGGQPNLPDTHGGGGGGGGYYAGGGGQAADIAAGIPGGGGAGGSSFTGGLYNASSAQGGGGTSHGQVVITWSSTSAPPPPENITIDGHPIADNLATKALSHVTLRGTPDDSEDHDKERLLVRLSRTKDFGRYSTHRGTYDPADERDVVQLTGLQRNTKYYVRIHAEDKHGRISRTYRATSFWTNRPPNPPVITSPAPNAQYSVLDNVVMAWNHSDPDPSDSQTARRVRFRRAETPIADAGPWSNPIEMVTSFEGFTWDAGTFKGNTLYDVTVQTRDEQGVWGDWADPRTFYVSDISTPPILDYPIKGAAIVAAVDNTFRWRFLGPQNNVHQDRADIQYRVAGTLDWTLLAGDVVEPGVDPFWLIPADTFEPQLRYEWQARTVSSAGHESDWSDSEFFWTTIAPASLIVEEDIGLPAPPLGQGNNRVFIYERGGTKRLFEIPNLSDITWGRRRDDISNCVFRLSEWDQDLVEDLRNVRTWAHEAVVFRESGGRTERVWEGPVVRKQDGGQDGTQRLEFEAWDPWAYVYRRIMRVGYNDAYRINAGQQLGLKTVVDRAQQIVLNCLSYDDPNLIGYLTTFNYAGDATESRIVKDYQKTGWEEIDDLAANAGLDYTAIGRRLMLWDTHRRVGRLPELRAEDFSARPVVTEYGMSYANVAAVTNGAGIWGQADKGIDPDTRDPGPTGYVEMLASAYGETAGDGAAERELSKAARKALEKSMGEQATRNIASRYPAPIKVRVPDNSQLNPALNIGINQLVPGVWAPLRVTTTLFDVAQWQKLDSISVVQDATGEKVNVTFTTAPNGGEDPDADVIEEEIV